MYLFTDSKKELIAQMDRRQKLQALEFTDGKRNKNICNRAGMGKILYLGACLPEQLILSIFAVHIIDIFCAFILSQTWIEQILDILG